jgi:NAD(P)-dependent dehydrogenase (short-subunit alcohol dehydrogenase family)
MAFLEELTHGSGWAIVTSSVAVRQPLAEWPHYVAAKCALEGMLHVAACEYPDLSFLIVRPPKLLTDFAPQLGATQSALPPERVAAAVIKRIQGIPNPAQVEVIEDF